MTDFTTKQRTTLAGEGIAEPDGSFPIRNETDLRHAIKAIGRSKDPAKSKRHIKARAKALGLTKLLPLSWM